MNHHCYRVIFNKSLARLVVVSEKTHSHTKTSAQGGSQNNPLLADSQYDCLGGYYAKLKLSCVSVLLSLGVMSVSHASSDASTIIADPDANKHLQPIILPTASGVVSVNISTPNARGLSNNHYRQFDVGNQGVVLNNNRKAVGTELAGFVSANPYMARGEATTILNQVNSNNPSHLGGFIEVAGQKADVIIANPSGLVINGAGFINAGNVHLAVASSEVKQGQLLGYQTDIGGIEVNGKLNLQSTDYAALIAKTVQINSEIYGGHALDVIVGENAVTLQDGKLNQVSASNKQTNSSLVNQGANQTPKIALDISALGGMYAGKIHLIGTDKGVGVNHAGILYATEQGSAGGLTLDVQGNLINTGKLLAKDAMIVNTHSNHIQNDGTLLAEHADIDIYSDKLNNTGTITSTQTANITSKTVINNTGDIRSGVLQVQTTNLTNTGIIAQTGTGKLDINTKALNNQNQAVIGQSLYPTNQNNNVNSISTNTNTGGTTNQHTTTTSTSQTATTGNLNQTGNTSNPNTQATNSPSANGFINATNIINNTGDKAQIKANGDIIITADNTNNTNRSSIEATSLTTNTLTNTHSKIALDDINWQLTSFDNTKGDLTTKDTMVITSQSAIINTKGNLASGGDMVLTAKTQLDNTGGVIQSGDKFTVVLSDVLNHQGLITSNKQASLTATNTLDNSQGQILANQSVAINTTDFNNRGEIAARTVAIQAQTDIDHTKNDTLTAQNLSLSTRGKITNSDKLVAGSKLHLQAGNIDNNSSASLLAPKTTITAEDTISNQGLIHANDLNIHAKTIKNLGAKIYGGQIAITGDKLLNQGDDKGAIIAARRALTLAVDTVFNQHGDTIHQTATDNAWMLSQGTLSIHGKDGKDIKASMLSNLGARIESVGDMSLSVEHINNTNAHFTSDIQQVAGSKQYQEYIIPEHSSTKIDMTLLKWQPWSRAGYLSYKGAGELSVNLDNLGGAPIASVYDCQNAHDDSSCGINYQPNSPIWQYFGIQAPKPMPVIDKALHEPALPKDETEASCAKADITNTACMAYNQALADYNKALKPLTDWEEANKPQLDALDKAISAYNAKFGSPEYKNFTLFKVNKHQEQSVVTASAPAQLIAGGNIAFDANAIINDKSQVLAGGKLLFDANTLQNIDAKGERHTIENGTAEYTRSRWRGGFRRYHQRDWAGQAPFTTTQTKTITLPVTVWQENADGNALAGYGQIRPHVGAINININLSNQPKADVVSTPKITLPNSALYTINANHPNLPIIQTDPAFTNHKNWLSSEYMLTKLDVDANHIHKRLGDGYYEQKQLQDQYQLLTGRHLLSDYQSQDQESAFKTLMDQGIVFAKQHQLSLGVALSAKQMANLTTDMVWLVKQPITYAQKDKDGHLVTHTEEVLVPKLYLRPANTATARLQPDGRYSSIGARDIDLRLTGNLDNQGNLIATDKLSVQANNITNKGNINAKFVAIDVNQDLINQHRIHADHAATLTAGHDIINQSQTSHQSQILGQSSASSTHIRQLAQISVGDGVPATDKDGKAPTTLSIKAGNYVIYTGAKSQNQGGNTLISADKGIRLDAIKESSAINAIADDNNYFKHSQSKDIGSAVSGQGDITLVTTSQDAAITGKAVNISSQAGQVLVSATGDIKFEEGRQTDQLQTATQFTNKGLISKKTTNHQYHADEDKALTNTIQAKQITLTAGQNLQLKASNIASDTHIHLNAKGDVILDAAINSQDSQTHTHTKKSGLFISAPTAITLGKQITKTDDHHKKITHTGNQLAALDGNVIIEAGDKYEQVASDIYAKDNTKTINNPDAGNVLIKAQEAHITNATNTNTNHNAFYQKTSGITASVSSTMVDSAKSIDGLIDATQESQSTRLKAMGMLAAATKAKNMLDQVSQGSLGSIRAQATLGTSTNKNQSTSSHQSNQASIINTDGNLIFDIQGKDTDSDLVITGSHINVGNDLYQKVAGDVIYQASTQTTTTNSQNSSKGAGFGVYASTTIGANSQSSAGFTAHANLGKGSSTENATTHTNTTVKVAGTTHNDIKGNFTLDGANLTTKHLTGTVGKDLIIKSRQDTYQYDSKQQNIGISANIDFSGKLQNANINAGKQQLNAQYAQVTHQSGIIANTSSLNVQGQGSFTGGYLITDANQNHTQFAQGIQSQDIQNHLSYQGDALQIGVSIAPKSKNGQQDDTLDKTKHQLGLSGLGYGTITPTHKTSTTHSAITDQAGLSHINADNFNQTDVQSELNQVISNEFNKEQVLKELGAQVNISAEFGREIPKAVADFSQDQINDYLKQLQNPNLTEEQVTALKQEAQKWAEGGVYRVALHTAMSALATGTAEGAFATGATASAAPKLNHLHAKLKHKLSEQGFKPDTAEMISQSVLNLTLAGVGTSAGLDTGSTVYVLNTDVNNRQLHPDEIRFILDEDRVRRFADKYGLSEEEAKRELLQVSLAFHDKEWASIYNWNNFPKDGHYEDGETLRTRALDFLWDENEKYGSFDLFSKFDKSTYDDPVINLRKLFDNTDKTYVQDFLRISYQKVDPKVAHHDFIRGGQQGAVQANQEASWQKDLNTAIDSIASLDKYIIKSIQSDETGPIDDKKMQSYYENLLRIQGRYLELGYID